MPIVRSGASHDENFEKLVDMSLHDPTIRHFLLLHRHDNLSKEDMLLGIALVAIDQKNHYLNRCIELEQQKESPTFYANSKYTE